MNVSHYGFVCPINFSNEKYMSQEKEIFTHFFGEKIDIRYLWSIHEYFLSDEYYSYSYSQVLELTNYSYSY